MGTSARASAGRVASRLASVRVLLIGVIAWAAVAPVAVAQLRAVEVVGGLSNPLAFIQDPSDASVQYIVEHSGLVRALRGGVLQSVPFLDLTASITFAGEQGLLGLAFAPDYATSRRFYVYFNDPTGSLVIARFLRYATNPHIADPASRFDLRWSTGQPFIPKPGPTYTNHNGGNLAFGPDGYLYAGTGDGGGGNDPNHNAQNPTSLLGKMLRIDVDVPDTDAEGFDIPPDNLFSTKPAFRPEIWSLGLRNPWRWSFDNVTLGGTGALIIGDVGQSGWEEIDYAPPGRREQNYGWRNREGAHDNINSFPPAFLPLTDPIFEYGRSDGQSITGGYVYHGSQLAPFFAGRYFYADFGSGRIWSLALSVEPPDGHATASDRRDHTAELSGMTSLGLVSAFGEDAQGELYLVSWSLGRILKILPTTNDPTPAVVTLPATNVGPTGVTFNGTVNPNGTSATASFEYGLTSSYGKTVMASEAPGSGSSPVAVTGTAAGLSCGTLYHFRARPANPGGLTNGADAVFTTLTCANAEMIRPAPGSMLPAAAVAFEWTGGRRASQYWLYLGTTEGGNDLFNQDRGTNLDATVTGLPTDGRTLYARLWSLVGTTWQFHDYSYTATTATSRLAELRSPAPGSTLTASTVQLEWTGGSGVSQYWVYIGTTIGGQQLYNHTAGTNLSATVAGLPANGITLWVRLWSLVGSAWQFHDYQYTATTIGRRLAELTNPPPESTLTASTQQFRWTGGSDVSQYWLWVGTAIGTGDLLSQDRGTNLSAIAPGLPIDGRTLYVRLWSLVLSSWHFHDYTYTAATELPTQPAELARPAPGSTLTATTVQMQWTGGAGVSQYWLFVGTTAGGAELSNQDRGASLTAQVTGLPNDGGTLYLRLWSLIGGAWQFRDYTVRAAAGASAFAELTSPAPGSTLTASTIQFEWTGGSGASQYWLGVGTTPGAGELYYQTAGTNLSATVTGLPAAGGALYVRLWSLVAGTWQFHDYQYTATTGAARLAELTTPAAGSTLTASTVLFQWTGGTGVSQYWLYVGTTPGGRDLIDDDRGATLSATAAGLPADARTLYVRLWSRVGAAWQFNDYTCTSR